MGVFLKQDGGRLLKQDGGRLLGQSGAQAIVNASATTQFAMAGLASAPGRGSLKSQSGGHLLKQDGGFLLMQGSLGFPQTYTVTTSANIGLAARTSRGGSFGSVLKQDGGRLMKQDGGFLLMQSASRQVSASVATSLALAPSASQSSISAPQVPLALGSLATQGWGTVWQVTRGFSTGVDSATGGTLGRYRRGDTIDVVLALGAVPASPPTLELRDSASKLAWSGLMSTRDGGLTWAADVLIGAAFDVGAGYTAAMTYTTVGGYTTAELETFDVVPGGDSGGSVVALWHYNRPEANYVIAQLANGTVVQGRNPRL